MPNFKGLFAAAALVLLLLDGPTMAATVLTGVGGNQVGPGASVVATTNATIPTGSLIIVEVFDATPSNSQVSPSTQGGVTDSVGNTYHTGIYCAAPTAGTTIGIYYAFNVTSIPSGGTVTYTGLTTDFMALDVSFATNMNKTSSVFDGAQCGSGSNATMTTASLTPSAPGDIFFGTVHSGSFPTTWTQSAGYAGPAPGYTTWGAPINGQTFSGYLTPDAGTAAHVFSPIADASHVYTAAVAAFTPAPLPANTSLLLAHAGSSGGTATAPSCNPAAPAQASAVGYCTNTFSTNAFTTANTDMNKTFSTGFQWYPANCLGTTPTMANVTIGGDTSISVGQGGNNFNWTIGSAACQAGSPFFVGTAFGGGMYVEATLKFNAQALSDANGWPAWWANPVESDTQPGVADHWPGQVANYVHTEEVDFMEYFQGNFSDPLNQYGSGMHDWSGVSSVTHVDDGSNTNLANTAAFNSYHTYGMLWIAATSTTSGSVTFYLDGVAGFSKSWTQYTNQTPPPTGQPWAHGILDQQHLLLEIGSNSTVPVVVQSVNVWQLNASGNVHN